MWFVVLMGDIGSNMQKGGFQQLNNIICYTTESFFLCELSHGCWLKLACTSVDLDITQFPNDAKVTKTQNKIEFLSNISRTVGPTTKQSSSSYLGQFYGPEQHRDLFPR